LKRVIVAGGGYVGAALCRARIAPNWVSPLLWLLAATSLLSHLMSMLLHLPQAVAGAMLAGSLMLFGLFHGASTYGWRGIVWFVVVCLGVSNAFENLSILTGFPFGWYHYSDIMGPRLFLVPLLIGPAYFGVGYLSWTLARAILGDTNGRLAGRLVFATPIVASFIMVSWDLTIDPMMSTITHNWIWRDGGSYFGVAPANFLGWYLTVYVFLQAFALYARRLSGTPDELPGYWAQPLLAYSSLVIAPILSLWLNSTSGTVLDPTGQAWRLQDIRAVTALVGLFTVLPFWLLALFRLPRPVPLPPRADG
jgi:putative membrane protein